MQMIMGSQGRPVEKLNNFKPSIPCWANRPALHNFPASRVLV